MIQDTTIRSYETNIRPKLGRLESEVRKLLREHPAGLTNKEIAARLGKDASTISGIVRPLVVRKHVYEAGERRCSVTGNRAKVWRLTSQVAAPDVPRKPDLPGLPLPTAPLFPAPVSKVATNQPNQWL
jgi:hypothetical protein